MQNVERVHMLLFCIKKKLMKRLLQVQISHTDLQLWQAGNGREGIPCAEPSLKSSGNEAQYPDCHIHMSISSVQQQTCSQCAATYYEKETRKDKVRTIFV